MAGHTGLHICCLSLAIFVFADNNAWAEIVIDSKFEGGSVEVVEIDSATQTLHIKPKVENGRGFPCWWYFRADGIDTCKSLTLKVSANRKPFRESRALSADWARPDQAAMSDDNVKWIHTAKGKSAGESTTYEIKPSKSTMWFAWGPPFLPSHADALLKKAKATLPEAEIFELAKTRKGRSVRGIRFGAKPTDGKQPYGVWVQARQHAWEAGSSWVGQGFLMWAVSDDPVAVQLRKTTQIHFIPIMDVDSVAEGFGGKDAIPRDHNRDWDKKPVYPEVSAAQKMIQQLNDAGRFDIFIDLHNPGSRDRKPFFFGPKLESLQGKRRRNQAHWIGLASSLIEGCPKTYRFTSYIRTQEERDRVSRGWVHNHVAPHVMAATLETAWNRPEGSQEGYQKVGQQFGLTIARYLSTNPRRE